MTVHICEHVSNRSKERDDRDILRLEVGDRPHHVVVLLKAGDKVTNEIELGASDKHCLEPPGDHLVACLSVRRGTKRLGGLPNCHHDLPDEI